MMAGAVRHWLFKSEPTSFSWQDLLSTAKKTTCWDGVRNFQARNLLRDDITKGDLVLFYHSSTVPQVVMGTAVVVRSAYPDPTQFDPESSHFDDKANPAQPTWFMVDIRAQRSFKRPVTLAELRQAPALADMMLLKRGARLSVQPVSAAAFRVICKLGGI